MASTRRLAAIMFTDMVGSTASAQANEAEALKLRDEQAGLVRPLFAAHQGREIKSMGDGFLAEFDSALRAVQCAIDIQQHLQERNSQPGVASILLRIGVHLGDVEQRETDIFGDAVNIASRIEPVASPGGLCISGQVFDQIRNKIPNRLEKLPQTTLKGLQVPIDIYRVVLPWTPRGTSSRDPGTTTLAVLPFINISPDSKDEYFSDGLTEELITVISQLPGLRVTSRTSVMQYKATAKVLSQIGAELGVVSILEGSVRKAGNRLRVTAQLIDAESDQHLWAQTYDRELDDVFAVQTEIAKQVAEALQIKLHTTEQARLDARPAVRSDSYLAYLKGRTLMHHSSKTSLEAAKEQFELAISMDERNAAAYSGLADATVMTGWYYADFPNASWDAMGRRLAARAVELDPSIAEAHTTLALLHWQDFDYASAEREFKVALSFNPSYSLAHVQYGVMLEDQGRVEEASRELMLAEAADPLSEQSLRVLALHLLWLGRLDEALLRIRKLGELNPSGAGHHFLLAGYHHARSELGLSLEEMKRARDAEADPRELLVSNALASAWAGERERARAFVKELEKQPEGLGRSAHIAFIYGLLGDLDDCFLWLDKNSQTHNHPFQDIRLSPDFEPVRRDPRFQDVLKKMRLA
jgi:adenylate cyclase